MDARVTVLIARKEVRDALSNRWFLLYAAGFAVLALALSRMALAGGSAAGFAGFGRTAASLVNLVLLVVPLMGLTLGSASLAGERERGTLATLLAQPVTRVEVLLGKFVGLALALGAALALGFGLAGAVLAWEGGAVEAGTYIMLVAYALLLAVATLAIGFLISSGARRVGAATALALLVWLGLVFLGDLGLMGTSMTMRLEVGTLLGLTLLNPLEAYRVGAVQAITGSLDGLGPAGTYAVRTFGAGLPALFAGILALWALVALALAGLIFQRRGIL
jgi:Cu-processing system permease protein